MTTKTKRPVQWFSSPQNTLRKYAGIHLLVDFWFSRFIENPKRMEKILLKAAENSHNTPLNVTIHKFFPRGITGVILLAESHIAIHTWPERNYISIDLFTCGDRSNPYLALEYLKKVFKPKRSFVYEQKRGAI